VTFDDGHTCQIEEITTVRTKLFDKRVKRCEVCASFEKEFDFSWRFGGAEPKKRDSWKRCS